MSPGSRAFRLAVAHSAVVLQLASLVRVSERSVARFRATKTREKEAEETCKPLVLVHLGRIRARSRSSNVNFKDYRDSVFTPVPSVRM